MVHAMQQHAVTVSPVFEKEASWRVSREGVPVASVAIRREGGDIVVATELTAAGTSSVDPCRFSTLDAADAFVNDLIASFSYLGCEVVRT